MTNNFIPSKSVCPFCRKFTEVSNIILKDIFLTDRKLLSDILTYKANHIKCQSCGEDFFYEHNCRAINIDKNYAVASLPSPIENIPNEKSAIFKILGKSDFKFRIVKEFIYLIEKVRIFEFGLDDRVMEIIKYKYISIPNNLGTDAKIILTNSDSNTMVFTVFDDYDKPVASHRVSANVYLTVAKNFTEEIIHDPKTIWKTIDLNWAKTQLKENTNE